MRFEIKNRWTGRVQFTAEISCDEDASWGVKVGLAVRWAYESGAVLSGAVLCGAVLRGAVLSGADLRGADLRDADLRGAVLSGAVLSGADLRDAVLRGAVLSDAVLSDVPFVENIDAKILATIEENKKRNCNGLKMSDWHGAECDETNWCNTTHCRAGYAVCIAGKEGFELERKVGPATAGALIYLKSTPDAPIPDFYCTDDEAMEDLRERAAKQGYVAP